MRQRTTEEIKLKKKQYGRELMLNANKAIEALKQLKTEIVELGELAEVLSISEQTALLLFEKPRLTVRQVIFDIILFS
jgi:hypothetical protein